MNFGKIINWPSPARRKAAESAAAAVMSSEVAPLAPTAALAPGIVASRPQHQKTATLGMQGYAPIVAVSRGRNRCDGCKETVRPGVRHICIYNAHLHMDTLTAEERTALIAQLERAQVQPSKTKPVRKVK